MATRNLASINSLVEGSPRSELKIHEANGSLTDTIELAHDLIAGMPEQVAVVDEDWIILTVNSAWMEAIRQYGHQDLQPGSSYLQFCKDRAGQGHAGAVKSLEAICRIEEGGNSICFSYAGSGTGEGLHFELCIHRFSVAGHSFATIARKDVTELSELREARRQFAVSLIEEQIEERRRMARELHDSTLQLLAGLGMGFAQLRRTLGDAPPAATVAEMGELLEEIHREIRAISYLSYPPALEKLGLAEVLHNLSVGFGRRTGLDISFGTEGMVEELPKHLQLALYRIAQEALSNAHRHAQAHSVRLRLIGRRAVVHLIVQDDGIGFKSDVVLGVGLPGMRARTRELGGHITIRSNPGATSLTASLRIGR